MESLKTIVWTMLKWVTIWRFIFFTMFTAHLSLKWLKSAQQKHEPKVKVVRVNGQITEAKQSRPWTILRWVTAIIRQPVMLAVKL